MSENVKVILTVILMAALTIGAVFVVARNVDNMSDAPRCDKNGWFTSDGKLYRCEQIKAINDAPVEHGGKVNVN